MTAPEFKFGAYGTVKQLIQSSSTTPTGPTMDPASNALSSSSSRRNFTSSAYRSMARRIQTYPWKTSFVLTQDNLTEGWEHNNEEEEGWIAYQDIERIAAKISTFEHDLFQGVHNPKNMATRGFLKFKLNASSASMSSLQRQAAETTRALIGIPHGHAQAHGNSLLTSYRLLDILALQYNVHQTVYCYPVEKPIGPASSRFLDKYGQRLSDIQKLLFNFKSAWQASRKKRRPSGKSSANDLLLVHVKQALTLGQLSHAQKVEKNILAAALPITIMAMDESVSTKEPPELLDGLDSLVENKYLRDDTFSQSDKEEIAELFSKTNIRHMRKPHAISVHVTPLVNLLNVNLQSADVSEEDLIQTARIIGTHNILLLDTIERCILRAIFQIANGTDPLEAIDYVVQTLPWDEIGAINSDDEINQRFKPNSAPVDLSQCSPSRRSQQRMMQEFYQEEYPNAAASQNGTGKPSLDRQRHTSTGNPANLALKRREQFSEEKYKIQTVLSAPVLLSADAKDQEDIGVLDITKPCTLYSRPTFDSWTFYDPLGNSWTGHPKFHSPETLNAFILLYKAIKSPCEDHRPKHISACEESVLEVVTLKQRQSMTSREAQKLLRTRHVIQVGMEKAALSPVQFDLKTLSMLGALERPILVEDESIPNGDICRVFTLAGLYNIRNSGRAVSTLELPAKSFADVDAFSTDRRAYEHRKYCPEKGHTDSADRLLPLQWSLVALKGATRGIQISPDGTGTFVQCLAGKEWYILLRPIGRLDHCQFGDVHLFQQGTCLSDLLESFDVEAFLLLPGMAIFIRPCTPYCVLTVENAITHGAYFYSLSTMQDSFFGLAHNLANGAWIRPSRGQALRHSLRLNVQYVYNALIHGVDMQMSFFRHAMNPDSLTIDDVQDLLSVISIGILCNALDMDTYKLRPQATDKEQSEHLAQLRWDKYDYNALPYDDRVGCMLARGFAYELRDWFCHFYDIHGHMDTTTELIQKIIAHQAAVLLKVTLASDGNKKFSQAVKRQITNTFRKDSPESLLLADIIACIEQGTATSFMFISLEGCSVSKIDNPGEFRPRSIAEIHALGMSPLDKEHEKGIECAFEVYVEGANKRRRTGNE